MTEAPQDVGGTRARHATTGNVGHREHGVFLRDAVLDIGTPKTHVSARGGVHAAKL